MTNFGEIPWIIPTGKRRKSDPATRLRNISAREDRHTGDAGRAIELGVPDLRLPRHLATATPSRPATKPTRWAPLR